MLLCDKWLVSLSCDAMLHVCIARVWSVFECIVCHAQVSERVSWCHATCVGHCIGSLSACAHRSRRRSTLRPVRWPAGCQRCLWLRGKDLGPGVWDVSTDTLGTHKQSLLAAGSILFRHTLQYSSWDLLLKTFKALRRMKIKDWIVPVRWCHFWQYYPDAHT